MSKQIENSGELDRVERYVRQHYRDMSATLRALYFCALRIFEKKGHGIFKPLLKSEGEWCAESGAAKATVRKGLHELQRLGVIKYTPGCNGRNCEEKRKTVVSRCTIEQIRTGVDPEILHRFVPANVEAIAEKLQRRGTPWNGDLIKPNWNVTITGRLNHKRSPMSADRTNTKSYRIKALRKCLQPDEILLDCDWRAAEPTVLCYALRERGFLREQIDPSAIYEEISWSAGCSRDDAKEKIQETAYSACPAVSVPDDWYVPAGHFLLPLVAAIEDYRQELWKRGKPRGKANPRFAHTLLGRKIIDDRKKDMHRGRPISWVIQGTVADIFAKVVAQVLDDDAKGSCRFFLCCHDAVYVAVKQGSDYTPAHVMNRYAAEAGIPLVAKTETYGPISKPQAKAGQRARAGKGRAEGEQRRGAAGIGVDFYPPETVPA